MKHNYNNLMVPYYKDRISAMELHIKKLESRIEFLEAVTEINEENHKLCH